MLPSRLHAFQILTHLILFPLKMKVILPGKKVELFGNSKESQFGTRKL